MKNISISEYGYIYFEPPNNLTTKFTHNKLDTENEFKELYKSWENSEIIRRVLSFDGGKYFQAQNYVGIIQTQNLSIEILPKIYTKGKEENIRDIFINMLKVTLGLNSLKGNKANLHVTKNKNIFEGFISLFVNSVDELIKKGLKSSYIEKEDNQYFLKGKLKFNEHIKRNYVHKERFYVQFDEYMANRVENKLLKSTINLLLKKTNDYQNKKALRQQLFVFDDVNISQNYESDISKINMHRGMEYYELPLKFAKVFLKDKSFTSLRGKENVYALLFPMEKVFENYMEFVLNNSKEALGIKNILVNGRRNEYFLGSGKCKMARLQPDYLLEMKGSKDIVTDAKWKILDIKEDETKDCERVSISSNDVYQIFSYLHFYDCEYTAYLFVPQTIDFQKEVTFDYTLQVDQILKRSNKRIKVIPIDLNILKFNNHKLMLNIFEEKN